MTPGRWQVVVVATMLLLDVVMFAVIVGIADTYSRHAEVLDETTVDACVAQAEAAEPALMRGDLSDRDVDFDGQNVLRVRSAREGRADLVIHCLYSLPEDDANPPVIEDVWVTKE